MNSVLVPMKIGSKSKGLTTVVALVAQVVHTVVVVTNIPCYSWGR